MGKKNKNRRMEKVKITSKNYEKSEDKSIDCIARTERETEFKLQLWPPHPYLEKKKNPIYKEINTETNDSYLSICLRKIPNLLWYFSGIIYFSYLKKKKTYIKHLRKNTLHRDQ